MKKVHAGLLTLMLTALVFGLSGFDLWPLMSSKARSISLLEVYTNEEFNGDEDWFGAWLSAYRIGASSIFAFNLSFAY